MGYSDKMSDQVFRIILNSAIQFHIVCMSKNYMGSHYKQIVSGSPCIFVLLSYFLGSNAINKKEIF